MVCDAIAEGCDQGNLRVHPGSRSSGASGSGGWLRSWKGTVQGGSPQGFVLDASLRSLPCGPTTLVKQSEPETEHELSHETVGR